ncbi:outer membrane beta-barrel [Fusarium albosuccineum]|uniref:Outer membrane beta-barrel n=1 Tax=Fusarium albosuccineum TaxID=1237068 RepID=A0A8H4L299_9HYPO|nr:outer membrane beta-barrel [Fusarium albosuccineum]
MSVTPKTNQKLANEAPLHSPTTCLDTPRPTLDFDIHIAGVLGEKSFRASGEQPRQITTIVDGLWSSSFGRGKVLSGGYSFDMLHKESPSRIVEAILKLKTNDEAPATLEIRTRGTISGPSDILDKLLDPLTPDTIDSRLDSLRMFSDIKTSDLRYAETVNVGMWVSSCVWHNRQIIIDSYRVS